MVGHVEYVPLISTLWIQPISYVSKRKKCPKVNGQLSKTVAPESCVSSQRPPKNLFVSSLLTATPNYHPRFREMRKQTKKQTNILSSHVQIEGKVQIPLEDNDRAAV